LIELSLRLGCTGWSYQDWVGPFYPKETRSEDYLSLYSRIFDCVEVDSTFYRAPSAGMVQHWYNSTPPNFILAPKIPKRITHDQHLEDTESYMEHFIRTVGQLKEKLGPFIVQLPPSFKNPKHLKALTDFIENLETGYRYAIEFRHESWFNSDIERLLATHSICQVWSINQYLTTPAARTSEFVYLRFVGDRAINQFSKLQKDQTQTMKTWSKALQEVGDSVKERFVFFNNHFAGFGPGSVNEFRRLMGLVELDWSDLNAGPVSQKTLFDFSAKK
jgi:uncharacterized protein YecE (DUF72 family)